MAAMTASYTAAAMEAGRVRPADMPLPRARRWGRPSSLLTLAQALRLTTVPLDFGELAFLFGGEFVEEVFADDLTEDGVAKELESFIAGEAIARAGGVGHGAFEQRGVLERVLEDLLAG